MPFSHSSLSDAPSLANSHLQTQTQIQEEHKENTTTYNDDYVIVNHTESEEKGNEEGVDEDKLLRSSPPSPPSKKASNLNELETVAPDTLSVYEDLLVQTLSTSASADKGDEKESEKERYEDMINTVIPLASTLLSLSDQKNKPKQSHQQSHESRAHTILCQVAEMGLWSIQGPKITSESFSLKELEDEELEGFRSLDVGGISGTESVEEDAWNKPWGM